jgi:CRISPR-associated protein Csm2
MSRSRGNFDASFIRSDDAAVLVKQAEQIAQQTKGLKPAQIRRLYGPVVRMRMEARPQWDLTEQMRGELLLLKPKLAYTAAREEESKKLTDALDACIDQVENGQHLKAFCDFFEAYVGYHKQHEGSQS